MRYLTAVPVYNEEESVRPLCDALHAVLSKLDRSYEILIIDDGSTDASWERLVELSDVIPHLNLIRLRRNFGQTAVEKGPFLKLSRPSYIYVIYQPLPRTGQELFWNSP